MDVFCVVLFIASLLLAIFYSIPVAAIIFLAACVVLAGYFIHRELEYLYDRREYMWKQQERYYENIQKEVNAIKKELKKK